MLIRFFVLLLIVTVCFGGTATQTDWSGGGGVAGPVTEWSNQFSSATGINEGNISGELVLSYFKHTIATGIEGVHSVRGWDLGNYTGGITDVIVASDSIDHIVWFDNVWPGHALSWTERTIVTNSGGASGFDVIEDYLGTGNRLIAVTDDISIYTPVVNYTKSTLIESSAESAPRFAVLSSFQIYTSESGTQPSPDYPNVFYANGFDLTLHSLGLGTSTVIFQDFLSRPGAMVDLFEMYHDDPAYYTSHYLMGMDAYGSVKGCVFTENSWDWEVISSGIYLDEGASMDVADIDGDGVMDILASSLHDNDILWYKMVSNPWNWTENTIDANFTGATDVSSSDLDDDGDMDVVAASYSGGNITWWENADGTGTTWIEHTIDGNFAGATSVDCADVNRDDSIDILGTAEVNGEVAWWDVNSYSGGGYLESSILDLQEPAVWGTIDWPDTAPANSSISLQVRSSDDSDTMGAWSDTLYSPCSLSGILANGDSLFQYRVVLNSLDSTITPSLADITITWDLFTETEDETEIEIESYSLLGATTNPTHSNVSIGFALPSDSRATLSVFDITGRIVDQTSGDYPAGSHLEVFSDLMPGVYLIRMKANDFTAVKQFVVIE